MSIMLSLLINALMIYWFLIIARALMSWFPIRDGSPLAPVHSFVWQVTEPVLKPVRQVIPQIGMMDISVLVVLIGIRILIGILRGM